VRRCGGAEFARGSGGGHARRGDRAARGFLVEYQDKAYADRYRALVDLARKAERDRVGAEGRLPMPSLGLLQAARVQGRVRGGRLHTLPDFRAALAREFEGELRVAYHFAPPLFPGRPRKRRFGPWIRPLLGTLARCAGYAARRSTLSDGPRSDGVSAHSSPRTRRRCEALQARSPPESRGGHRAAALPQRIRGYGPVKERAIAAAQAREANCARRSR